MRADGEAAAQSAAEHIAAVAEAAVAERDGFLLALSGGRTPGRMLAALAQIPLPWNSMHVFQVDERVAPAGDPERNLTQLQDALLGPTPLPAENLHPMPVEDDDLDAAARRYARVLMAHAGTPAVLDLVHLGVGDDGHTASLVPGDGALAVTDADVALTSEYRGHRRLTLTLPVLNRARQRLWLVTGEAKSAMLARLRASDGGIPAGRVQSRDSVIFTDLAAG
jgi:6-phosphogluconolactonase